MEHFAIKDEKVRGKANEILLKIIGLEHEKIFMMFLSKIFEKRIPVFLSLQSLWIGSTLKFISDFTS